MENEEWRMENAGKSAVTLRPRRLCASALKISLAFALASATATVSAAAPDPMIAITPVTRSMEQTGGTAAINTSGSGTWRASVSDNWILLTSSSGTAGYPVGYTVAANNGVETRIGYVYVSGYTHTITQAGLGATLGSYSAEFEREGGTGSVAVNAPSGKTWHAKSNASWITVSASSGTGSRTLSFTVSRYDEVSTRSGTLTVADNTFTVYQTGRRMQLKTTSATTDYFAGTIKIRVNALADTEWSVAVNDDWMTIVDAGNGHGGDEVKVAVAENQSYNSRSGTVTIGTETFSVTQLGRTSLIFKINPTEVAEFGVDGASGERIAVTATQDLGWTAASSADWIELYPGSASGSGNGSVMYKVKPNPTLYPRSGVITVTATDGGVAEKRLEISQEAAVSSLTVDSYEFEAMGETLTVGVNTGSIVGWNVVGAPDWMSVSGVPVAGPANITLAAAANTSVQPRSGTVLIAGHEFHVSQRGRGVTIEYDETKIFDTDGKTTGDSVDNVISVIADADVEWTAVASDPTWIVIYEGLSGRGNGTVKFIVAPYVGSGEQLRTGMITIGGQVAYVTQRPYELSIEPNGQWVDGNAGAGEIQVALDIDGVWNAIATEPWIVPQSGFDSGKGSGKVLFSYTDNNTGKQRTGKIVINGAIYTLTQAARQNVSVSASVGGHGGHVGGGGVYNRGTAVELVAIPEDGYEFCAWTLPNGTEVSTNAILHMTATDSLECVAHFVALAPDIESVESSQSGVLLRWRNVAWATRYHVWRGTSPDLSQAGKIATLANDGTTEYSDASVVEDGDYWYWIEAEGMDEDLFGGAARGWRGKERFAITYENLRGATHSNPASFTVDDAFSFTPPSPRVGYTFTDWTPSDVVAGTASELVVRANWHQNEYAVNFDANGGTGSMEDEAFTYGLWKYLTSNTFARVGHAFAGWSDVAMASSPSYSDGESVKNLTAEPNGSVTLYAMWTAESYTITLDSQGGSGGTASVTATYGGAMPSVSVPTRTGYTFGGYYTAANGGGTQYYTASGASARNWGKDTDTTLYAKWTAKTFKIILNKQSGAGGTASVTATYDSAMPSVTVPTRTGYTFGGYYTAANGGGTQYYTVSGASARRWDKDTDTTLYAKWTGNTYAVTLDWQGGSGGVASATATYGSAMPTITVPTRTGYTFGGYYTAANGGGTQYYTASGVSARSWDKTAATTLYAKWTLNIYAVTLDAQGGTGGTASVTTTYGSVMPSVTIPTRTGYTFGGYWTDVVKPTINGLSVKYYDISSSGYSIWTQSEAAMLSYFANRTPTIETNTLAWGETLQSWFQENYDTSYYFSEFPGLWLDCVSTNRYHGKYANHSQECFAMLLEGTLDADIAGEYSFGASCDDEIVIYIDGILICATRDWRSPSKGAITLSSGSHRIIIGTYENGGSQGMFVSWKRPGDTSYSPLPQSVISTDGTGVPSVGGTQYYTASGTSARNWDKTAATTLYAKWTANTYSVMLNRQSGAGGSSSVTATYGGAMPAITVPTRTGYTFGGYYTAANGGGIQYYTAAGASVRNWDRTVATTLYAKWTANTYSVMLNRQSGAGGSSSVTATYGGAMSAITVPTRTGYTFGGYYTAANGGGIQYYTAAGASARNWDRTAATTLFAKWTPIAYKIAYNAYGGTLPKGKKMATQKMTYGKAAKLTKNAFTRKGYVFAGWAKSKANAKNGVIAYANASAVKNLTSKGGTVTLYAVWAKPTYKVAFYANGGSGKTVVQTFKYGKAASLAACKFKAPKGKKFAGWATSKANAKAGKVKYKNKQSVKNLIITGKTVKLYAVWRKK